MDLEREKESTRADLIDHHLRRCGLIPYNTASVHYLAEGISPPKTMGGDCRLIAKELHSALGLIGQESRVILQDSKTPRRRHVVLIEGYRGNGPHVLDARIKMQTPLPISLDGTFQTSAFPVVRGIWTTATSELQDEGRFQLSRKMPHRDKLNTFVFTPEQNSNHLTHLEIASQQGRTFIFAVIGNDGGLYQLSYCLNNRSLSVKRIGGQSRQNADKAKGGTSLFETYMNRMTEASGVSKTEILEYFDEAREIHNRNKAHYPDLI